MSVAISSNPMVKCSIFALLGQLSAFVHHLRQIYRYENTYHNFEHALDVLQATHSYLRSAGMVPPVSILLEPGRMWRVKKKFDSGPLITSLGLRDLFVLYVAAIGHDVGHPGFSNVFMVSLLVSGNSVMRSNFCRFSEKCADAALHRI